MTTHYLKSKIGGAVLSLAMLMGIGLATSVTTQAQWPNNGQWGNQRNRDYEREQRRRQREYEREQRRRQQEQRRNGDYRNDGYNNGSYGNNGYYGNDNLRQTALNAGYNNGIEEGRKDRRNGDRYDFRDEGDYQKATEDYSSKLGDRELYRRYFRQGFENGYRTGYNGY